MSDTEATEMSSILLDAFGLVHGSRGEMYGPPWQDYARTVEIFNACTGNGITVAEGILFMLAVKLSRVGHALQEGFPAEMIRDSLTDLAGYAECLWMVVSDDDDGDDGGEPDGSPDLDPVDGLETVT